MSEPQQKTPEHFHLFYWVRDLVLSLCVAGFVIVFVYQPVKVEGTSMAPGLQDNERIFINKFVYRFENIGRGDVVVFHYPHDQAKSYIKRVVGMPGDLIRIDNGRVYVNDHRLAEPYVPKQYADSRSYAETVVPPGAYFVLGDHRNMSSDSRDFGPVNARYIYGKAVFAYWPMDALGRLK